jgi:hypothetical protein
MCVCVCVCVFVYPPNAINVSHAYADTATTYQ